MAWVKAIVLFAFDNTAKSSKSKDVEGESEVIQKILRFRVLLVISLLFKTCKHSIVFL